MTEWRTVQNLEEFSVWLINGCWNGKTQENSCSTCSYANEVHVNTNQQASLQIFYRCPIQELHWICNSPRKRVVDGAQHASSWCKCRTTDRSVPTSMATAYTHKRTTHHIVLLALICDH